MHKIVFILLISSSISYLGAIEIASNNDTGIKYILLGLFTMVALFIVYKGFVDLNKMFKERKNQKVKNKESKRAQKELEDEVDKLQEQINIAVLEQNNTTAQELLEELNKKKKSLSILTRNKE